MDGWMESMMQWFTVSCMYGLIAGCSSAYARAGEEQSSGPRARHMAGAGGQARTLQALLVMANKDDGRGLVYAMWVQLHQQTALASF
jgi:hypothetical protein